MNELTAQEKADIIFNFAYLMEYDVPMTTEELAIRIERHNASPQARTLSNYLKAKQGIITRLHNGLSIGAGII